jgi:hypothetical protein
VAQSYENNHSADSGRYLLVKEKPIILAAKEMDNLFFFMTYDVCVHRKKIRK